MTSRFSYCDNIVKTSDEDRYLGALFAPQDKRDALMAIYAFNVEVGKIRESVSEPMLGHIRLQWWREAIDSIYEGVPRKHEVVLALADTIKTFTLARDHFETYLNAREKDLEEDPFENLNALLAYIDGTAGKIFQLASYILSPAGEGHLTHEMIIAPARAWALVGLIRAMPFALQKHWLFLPKDMQAKHGITATHLYADHAQEGLRAAMTDIIKVAESELNTMRDMRATYSADVYPALLSLKLVPRYIREIMRDSYDPLKTQIAIPRATKQILLMWMMLSGRI